MCLGLQGCYVIKQGYYQNNLINAAEPIDAVIKDPLRPSVLGSRLSEVKAVLRFAHANGLNTSGAYRHFVDTDDRPVSYSLAVAKPFEMELMRWWFPIVGAVPYLGYYEAGERDAEVKRYVLEGFDTYKGQVAAFSSLGWFPDPVFASYLRRPGPRLSHLLFHELTHRTLWLPGKVSFNENFAEYAASYLNERYLAATGGDEVLAEAKRDEADRIKFRLWLGGLRDELQALYRDHAQAKPEILAEMKRQVIDRKTTTEAPQFANKKFDDMVKRPWNNASILATSLYTPDTAAFAKAYECLGANNLGDFLAALRSQQDRLTDEERIAEVFCAKIG